MKKKRRAAADIGAEAAEKPEPKRIRLSKRERRERFGTSFFMIPSIAGVLAFFILPFLVVIYYSLIDDTATGDFVGLYNFAELFRDSAFKMAPGLLICGRHWSSVTCCSAMGALATLEELPAPGSASSWRM